MAQDWYYIRDGQEKTGPVSPSHLKSLAASGELRPTDLVWTSGMTEWKAAAKIKGLFDTPPPAPVAVPAPATVQQPPSNPDVPPVEAIPVVPAPPSHRELPPALTAAWMRATFFWKQLTPRGKVVAGTGGGCFMLFFFCCGLGSLVSVGSNGGVGLGGGSNSALRKMKHKIVAMPAEQYKRLMAAFDAEDPDQVAALLSGVNGYSLFTPAELRAISSPGPKDGCAIQDERRKDSDVAYYQDLTVSEHDYNNWASFFAGGTNGRRRAYKSIRFHSDGDKGDLYIDRISTVTFVTGKNTEVEVVLSINSQNVWFVNCHKKDEHTTDDVPDTRREWNPERNMYEMKEFIRKVPYTRSGKKLFKIEFDDKTGKAQITRGEYKS